VTKFLHHLLVSRGALLICEISNEKKRKENEKWEESENKICILSGLGLNQKLVDKYQISGRDKK